MRHLVVFLILVACAPAAAQRTPQQRGPVVIVIPEAYPAFDPEVRAAHPEAGEVYAIVQHSVQLDPAKDDYTTVVLLNPIHADAATLRAALIAVHNYRASSGPVDPRAFRAFGAPRGDSPGVGWSSSLLNGTLDALQRRLPVELANFGKARFLVVANPSAALRPHGSAPDRDTDSRVVGDPGYSPLIPSDMRFPFGSSKDEAA